MSKVYHFVRRTRYWLDTDDEQHLKLFLYIENTHTSPITVTVDWSWAGSGSDPYGIDGVSESKTLQPGEIWQNVKDLLRNPPIDVGVTTTDKIIADVKTTVDSVEYIKEVQFIPTIYRRLPEYLLWNFDDGTFQGWGYNDEWVQLTTSYYHSIPYSISVYLYGRAGPATMLSRTFNFANAKSITLKLWTMSRQGNTNLRLRVVDPDTENTLFASPLWVPHDEFGWGVWGQKEFDLSDFINQKVKICIDFTTAPTCPTDVKFYAYIDDIELYVSY